MPGYPVHYDYMHAPVADTGSSVGSESESECTWVSTVSTPTNSSPTARADRERTFLCPEPGCDGRFHRKFTLREHLKTHTGEKPYQCAVQSCGKLFSTSGNLSRHRRLHMLTRIKCPILDCARVFTKQEKLLRHLKVHMGSAAHACSYPACAKTFSTSGNLSRHIRTQHRGESRHSSTSNSRCEMPSTGTISSFQLMHASMPAKSEVESTTPIDIYSHGLLSHQHQQRLSSHGFDTAGHPDGISDTDVMLLLDCLFVSDASRASVIPSALHSSRGFRQEHQILHTQPQDSFEVYF
ncbi:Zinc finger protein [Globisporangium polare]